MSNSKKLPVGTVLAYAGVSSGPELNELGWAICDGTTLNVKDYPELFSVIGTCNGGDGASYFNLPNYQGYFLYGFIDDEDKYPDIVDRVAPASGGATGANVGSIQSWATGKPRNAFKAIVKHAPSKSHRCYSSSGKAMLMWGDQICSSSKGGDSESRPINAYVNFIIQRIENAELPEGVIVPFAGNNSNGSRTLQDFYLLCDGKLCEVNSVPELYKAILTSHGGKKEVNFNLPDYRGRFLRGVSGKSGIDPDVDSRAAMNPGGNSGNKVGSIQEWATGKPQTSFNFKIDNGTDRFNSSVCAGHKNTAWNDSSKSVDICADGGDCESRPDNLSVDFYILGKLPKDNAEIFPIGGIIGIPGTTPPPSNQWIQCNGSICNNTEQYVALYEAIGHDNGGDIVSFSVPNLCGKYMRGCDHGAGRDPEAVERRESVTGGNRGDNVGSVQGWATGKPKVIITGEVEHLSDSSHHNAASGASNKVTAYGDSKKYDISGGDNETRPVNAFITFYIKYNDES